LFVILSIQGPHSCLLINVLFFHSFSFLFHMDLSSKFFSHSLLIRFQLVIH
jgi:hypothetical protein